MINIRRILVATDFSAPSETAVNYARAMARAFGAELRVLHVFEPLWLTSADMVGGGVAVANMVQGLEETARKQLEEVVTEEDRRELRAVPVMVTSESPSREIARYASEEQVDLLVIGTHGRSGLTRLLIGSVAEKVVRLAPCPVLTVHHPEHEFVMPDALQVISKATAQTGSAFG